MKALLVLAALIAATPSFAPNQQPASNPISVPIRNFGRSSPRARIPRNSRHPVASAPGAANARSTVQPQLNSYLRMPLDFEMNRGQARAEFTFLAHGPSYALGVSPTGLSLALQGHKETGDLNEDADGTPQPSARSDLDLRLVGVSENASVTGLDQAPGSSNYFIGNDPAQWHTLVPHFKRVKIAGAYPGIDLIFYGNHQQLEYDFTVAPGADPSLIQLQVHGAQTVKLDGNGNVVLQTAAGAVELQRPVAYQDVDGTRRNVESRFEIAEGNVLKIDAYRYDRSRALVVDPVLLYSVALGGSNGNEGVGLTVDASGYAYVTGNTCSADFPTSAGAMDNIHTTIAAKDCHDGFVTKLDPSATTLVFSDFIGGAGGSSSGTHAAVDSSGNVFVAGATGATSFPTVSNIGRSAPAPCGISKSGYNCPQGFILKLSPDGSQLLFSSLLGGSQANGAYQVKLNPVTGDLVVLGETNSSDLQPIPNTLETSFAGGSCSGAVPCFNSFLVGLNPASGALKYSTFLGGAGNNWSSGLAFDATGNIYVAGSTQPPMSSTLGTVTHTYGPSGGVAVAGTSLFVARLNLSGNTITPGYLTLIQADADTGPSSIAVDSSGNAYFAGSTAAHHLGVTTGAYQAANNAADTPDCLWGPVMTPFLPTACGTGLVGKLDSTGALSFLTYLGGSGQDEVEALGLDGSGNIWLTGVTSSSDFPLSTDHYTNPAGFATPFLAEMSNNGQTLPFSTLVAESFGQSTDLFVDTSNNVYIAGFSTEVTSTPATYPPNPGVYIPMFVQKWGPGAAPSISVTTTGLTFNNIPMGGLSAPQTATIQNTGTAPLQLSLQLGPGISGSNQNDFLVSSNCSSTLAAGASCAITVSFEPGPPAPGCVPPNCTPSTREASLLISNNAAQGPQTLQLSGSAGVGASISINPNPIVFPAQAAGTTSTTPLNVQVESAGDSTLVIGSIALSGTNASDFQLSLTGTGGPSCTSPVPAGSFCDLYLTFSPPSAAVGTRSATVTFTDSAGDSPQNIPVTGIVAAANSLNLSPLTLKPTFPVAIGTSTTVVFTLQNPSTSGIQVTSLTLAGANAADFTATTSSCASGAPTPVPFNIAAGASCYVDFTVAPSAGASGLRQATLTVGTSPANTSLPTIALEADAVTNTDPGLSVSVVPNPMNFGGLLIGETSNNASELLTIANYSPIPCAGGTSSCGAPLTINAITPGLSDYTVQAGAGSPTCTPFPATIASGSTCTYALVFTPAQAGSRNTTVTIQSNDPQGAVQVPVFGSGLSLPLGEFLQTALNFGNSAIGVASPPLTTTLQNNGLSNLTISAVTASTNFAVSANTCTAAPLARNATCTVAVTFTPPSAGPFAGTLTITDNGGFSQQQAVNLTGAGATGPQLRIMPPTLNFGNQAENSLSPAQTITLTSTGDSGLSFPANALRSTPDFILQSTTCGTSLAPGANCTVSIQFRPTTITIPEAGTLLITDNATGSPQPVYMQGTGTQSTGAATTTALTSSSNPATFGQSVTFTATVSGPTGDTTVPTGTITFLDGTATLGTVSLNGSAQATFTTSTLSAGSHSITASYGGDTNFLASTSTALTQIVNAVSKAATATTVTSSANPSTSGQSVTFTATVTGPAGNSTVPTGSVNFMDGTTLLGTGALNSGARATFSTSSLGVASHSITAVYAGDNNFLGSTSTALTQVVNAVGQAATTTTVASSANPSTSGQTVTFTATVAGPAGNSAVPTGSVNFMDGTTLLGSGTLSSAAQATLGDSTLTAGSHSITAVYGGDSNFLGSTSSVLTQVVNATATGTFTLSANPTTITVTDGSSGTTTLSVTPSGGFNQPVTFACSGLPTASTCTFSPSTVSPSGTTSSTSTLTIATDVASLTKPAHRHDGKATTEAMLALVLFGLIGLVRARRRLVRLVSAVVLLATLGLSLNSCGGGSSSSTKTPTGSSAITVTAIAGAAVQSTTITVVVQ